MSTPVRRAFKLLRQHFLLLSGPWLGVCAVGFAVNTTVRQILVRLYPVVDPRSLHGAGYVATKEAFASAVRVGLARTGLALGAEIMVIAFEVAALAMVVLLVTRITRAGDDTFSSAFERLKDIPSVAGNLLKFYVMVLLTGLATILIGGLLVAVLIPLRVSMHIPGPPPHWALMLSADLATLFFALCVTPFFLNLVWRLQNPSSPDDDAPDCLLMRAMSYSVAAAVIGVGIGSLMHPLLVTLGASASMGALIHQGLVGLAVTLVSEVPTVVCVVTISLLVMDAGQPVIDVNEAEPA